MLHSIVNIVAIHLIDCVHVLRIIYIIEVCSVEFS